MVGKPVTCILADYHHSDLFESLQLVFVDRFGWELYRPIGMDWFGSGCWTFGREQFGDAIARQFLEVWDGDVDEGDCWKRADTTHPGRVYKMVTLEQARSRRWDFVLSSVPENDPGFRCLAQEGGARWIVHVGNQWQHVPWDADPLVIATATIPLLRPERAALVHQEFSLGDFRYVPPMRRDLVGSFVQCFPTAPAYSRFCGMAAAMPDFEWRVHGAYGEAPIDGFSAGVLDTTPAVAAAMRECGFIWHTKYWSDGFGHVVHNAFACGRPVVGGMSYYADKLAGPLWLDGVTCIDVDSRGDDEVQRMMREIRDDPDRHLAMCVAAAARFRDVVDFEADAEQVRRLLS